jgi:hypothetical protein
VYALAFEPLPPIIYLWHATTNALGLQSRTDLLDIALVTATWFTSTDDAHVSAMVKLLLNAINASGAKLGGLDPFIYLNYAGRNRNPIASYGVESVAQLLQVRSRVDLNKVFTNQVPGGYKIS